jgi:hypothetical protein
MQSTCNILTHASNQDASIFPHTLRDAILYTLSRLGSHTGDFVARGVVVVHLFLVEVLKRQDLLFETGHGFYTCLLLPPSMHGVCERKSVRDMGMLTSGRPSAPPPPLASSTRKPSGREEREGRGGRHLEVMSSQQGLVQFEVEHVSLFLHRAQLLAALVCRQQTPKQTSHLTLQNRCHTSLAHLSRVMT